MSDTEVTTDDTEVTTDDTGADTQGVVIQAELLPEEFETLKNAATAAGLSTNDFLRRAISNEALLTTEMKKGSKILIKQVLRRGFTLPLTYRRGPVRLPGEVKRTPGEVNPTQTPGDVEPTEEPPTAQ